MNATIHRTIAHLTGAAALSLLVVLSCARASSQQAPPTHTDSKVRMGIAISHANPLDGDPRLRRPLTLRRDNITIEQALAEISELTGVHCVAEHIKFSTIPIAFRFRGTPLKDAMDGIAHLGRFEWYKNSDRWVLRPRYDPHALDVLRPHSAAEAKLFQLGKQFLDQAASMSPQDQKQLSFDGSIQGLRNHPGVSFSGLPGAMQNTVQGMLSATLDEYASQSRHPPISLDSLGSCNIDIQPTGTDEGASSYSIDISNGSVGVAATFTVFTDPRDGTQIVPMYDIGPAKEYDDNEEGTSRQKALQTDTRLGSLVSLAMKNATFAEAVQQLGVKCGLSFTAEVWSEEAVAVRKEVNLSSVPLREALDRVTALYGYTSGGKRFHYTWGETSHGVMVFHFAQDSSDPE